MLSGRVPQTLNQEILALNLAGIWLCLSMSQVSVHQVSFAQVSINVHPSRISKLLFIK